MVATDQVEKRSAPGANLMRATLTCLAALTLFLYWGLVDFDPKPYGTLPIDGPEVPFFAPAGGSPVLIFAVAGLLLFGSRARLAKALGSAPLWAPGILLLAGAATIQRWADYVYAPELLIPSLIMMLLGAGAILGGRSGLRAIAAPSLFLIFAIPIPASIVNLIVWPLQLSTAASADAVLRTVGYTPERFGEVIVLGGHAFHVVESCSGMRMIETLIMAGSLYSILFFRRPAQVVAILLLAPFFGYFVNLVRVLSIIFNPYAEYDSIHTLQGVVMLVAGVLLIAGFDNLLRRLEAKSTSAPPQPAATIDPGASKLGPRLAALASLLVILNLGNLLIPHWQPTPAPEPRALRLSPQLTGGKPRGLKLDRQFLGSVGVTKWLHRDYEFMDSRVQVQILADDRLDRRGSLISAKTAVPGPGSVAASYGRIELAGGAQIDRYLFRNRDGQTLVYHWYEGTSSPFNETIRNALVLDRGPTRRSDWALSVRLSTAVPDTTEGMLQADTRLQAFATIARDALK